MRATALALMVLAAVPSVATAGIDLSWNQCVTAAPADNVNWTCTPGSVSKLYANFQIPAGLTQFVAMDGVIDVEVGSATVPPFWQYQTGGCNAAGLEIFDDKPEADCPAASNPNPWGAAGGAADAFIGAYAPGFGGANRARMVVTVARASSSPVNLTAGQNYYGFHLAFAGDAAGECVGCDVPAVVYWTSGTFYSIQQGTPAVVLTSSGLRSKSATVNGGIGGFELNSSAPATAPADGPIPLSVYGRGIAAGATLRIERTGQSPIAATGVSVSADGRAITGTLDLLGAQDGAWDVVVENPGGATARLTGALDVDAALAILSVVPNQIGDIGTFPVMVNGRGMDPGARLLLRRTSFVDHEAVVTSISPDGRTMNATFTNQFIGSGAWDVVVTNTGGETATLVGGMNVITAPRVNSISPDAASNDGVKAFAVAGAQLQNVIALRLERAGQTSIAATSFTPSPIGNNIMASFDLTNAAAGTWDVVVNTGTLEARLTNGLRIVKVPVITSITPSQVGNGQSATITVQGSNLMAGELSILITGGGTPLFATNVVVAGNEQSATASIDPYGQPPGPRDVIVANHGVAADTLPAGLLIVSAPIVTSISPSFTGNLGPSVFTVGGTGLSSPASVTLERAGSSPIVGTSIGPAPGGSIFVTFNTLGAQLGPWDVVVTATSGYSGRLSGGLNIVVPPVIDSIVPRQAGNAGNTAFTIYGAHFVPGQTTVTFRGASVLPGQNLLVAGSGLSLTGTIGAFGHPPGPRDVIVSTNGGATSDTLIAGFTIQAVPRITSFTPNTASNTGPIVFTVRGSYLQPGIDVRLVRTGFPDIIGTSTVVTLDTVVVTNLDLTGVAPGVRDLVVRNANGFAATQLLAFNVVAVPEIDSIAPRVGSNVQTTFPMAVYGRNFSAGLVLSLRLGAVTRNASTAVPTAGGTRIDANFNLTGLTPAVYDVLVVNSGGARDTLPAAFTVLQGPTVVSVVPNFGSDSESAKGLVVTGTRFDAASTFSLVRGASTIPGTNPQVNGTTSMAVTVNLTSGTDGLWSARVDNADGTSATLANAFRIDWVPQPVSIAPTIGADTEQLSVAVTGTRFVAGSQLVLKRAGSADIPATGEIVAGETQITGTFDLRGVALGTWSVTVVHPQGTTSATLANVLQVFAGPRITSILPAVYDPVSVNATVYGSGFLAGAQVTLEGIGAPIHGTGEVTSGDGTQITVSLPLIGVPSGFRNVVVHNPDLRTATLTNGFLITSGPLVLSVTPPAAAGTGVVFLDIGGTGFSPGASARLQRTGQSDIVGSAVTVSADGMLLQAGFDLAGKALGLWDVTVVNPSGTQWTLPNGFEIQYTGPTFPAGLDVTWDACNLPATSGSLATTLDCTNPTFVKSLYANFQPPVPLPDFVALDAVIDIETGETSLPEFWRFDPGGCNGDGLLIDDAMPTSVCPTSANQTPWGTLGAASDALITAYVPNYNGGGRARMLVSVVRAIDDPASLAGGENYYGFTLTWTGDLTLCAGCTTPGEITLSSALLHSAGGATASVAVTGTGQRSNHVALNGGLDGLGITSVVPDRGRLTELVRTRIYGRELAEPLSVALTMAGRPDISGTGLSIAPDGRSLDCTFDLTQAVAGKWSVRITKGAESAVLTQGFRVMADNPEVTVLVPNGHERIERGKNTLLEWQADDDKGVATVDLYYSVNLGLSWTLIRTGLENSGSYLWRVTAPVAVGTALLRVQAWDEDGNSGYDDSDVPFSFLDDPTATLLATFGAVRIGADVEVSWRYGTPETVLRTRVERAATDAGPWSLVQGVPRARDGSTVVMDRGATAESWYRLKTETRDGQSLTFGPVRAGGGSTAAIGISGVRAIAPNPAPGRARIELTVARSGPVRLAVLDLQGREVAVLVDEVLTAGQHDVAWDARSGGRALPAGLYFVHFTDATRRQVTRVALAP